MNDTLSLFFPEKYGLDLKFIANRYPINTPIFKSIKMVSDAIRFKHKGYKKPMTLYKFNITCDINFKKCINKIKHLLQKNRNNPDLYALAGLVYMYLTHWDKAYLSFKKAVYYKPDETIYLLLLAYLTRVKGIRSINFGQRREKLLEKMVKEKKGSADDIYWHLLTKYLPSKNQVKNFYYYFNEAMQIIYTILSKVPNCKGALELKHKLINNKLYNYLIRHPKIRDDLIKIS